MQKSSLSRRKPLFCTYRFLISQHSPVKLQFPRSLYWEAALPLPAIQRPCAQSTKSGSDYSDTKRHIHRYLLHGAYCSPQFVFNPIVLFEELNKKHRGLGKRKGDVDRDDLLKLDAKDILLDFIKPLGLPAVSHAPKVALCTQVLDLLAKMKGTFNRSLLVQLHLISSLPF